MNRDKFRDLVKKLIDEASVVAPSINKVEKGEVYGSVNDKDLDIESYVSWEVEAGSLIRQLASFNPAHFGALNVEYENLIAQAESEEWHSKSILIHKIRQLLIAALKLIDSPLLKKSTPGNPSITSATPVKKGYGFIAMPMNPDDDSLDDVLDAVKEGASKCGVDAERIDEPQSNERITDRILESIQQAEYIFVDLTNSRPNVFFEAGYAHGLGKLPIYFAKHGSKIEFDLKDYPVIFYRNFKGLKADIEKRIKGMNYTRSKLRGING